ncbi:helix-turn-helix domain-containing protein [bacterium]|nr:helix-turn-helix domain-containing protein [bacterium]
MESIGKVLKKARLEKKLRLQDVYAQTKINLAYLKALENDTANSLPSPEYARIFLKGYARFLGLDTKKLLRQYNQYSKPSQSHRGKNTDEKTKKKVLLLSIIGLTLVLFIAIISTVRHFVNTVDRITLEEKLNYSDLDIADSPLVTNDTNLIIQSALDAYVKSESELLELKFITIDKTWIRIFADGKKLFGGTLHKGDEKVWYAKEKFHFRIGNAGGVVIELNGKKLPILGKKGEVFKKVIVTKDGIETP